MMLVRSDMMLGCVFDFVIISVHSINISPTTGPGIAKSKYF